jgi:hypothetical protein
MGGAPPEADGPPGPTTSRLLAGLAGESLPRLSAVFELFFFSGMEQLPRGDMRL